MSSDTNIWETGVNDNGNGTDNNQYFISDTSDAEKRLTIQRGTGNIGVGTNEPSQLLDVSGNINLSGNIYLSNTGTIYKNGQEYAGGSEGTSTVWQENGTKIHYNAGNVGINTSDPTETLEVVGNIKATSLEGDGSGITNLDATELTGIIDNARLPADISATNISGDGSGITNLDATELTGIIDNARLPANISATNISGDGAGITNLDATELTGIIDNARLPANISATNISGDGSGITNLDATELTGIIDNARLPADISITGDLTAKNLNVTGVTTTINTDTYQTENLEIISTGVVTSLKITHDTVSHDVIQVIDASGTQSLTMTHEGKIGIGTDSPSAPLHIYDTSDVLKVSNSEITINRNILPETNDSVDIGSAERKIRDMYISDNSLWIGDDHKLAVSGDGTMKFRKRRKSTLPKVLRDASGNDQAALDHINSLHGTSYQNVTELKLNHVLSYARTINPEYKTSDIFGDDTEDYDQDTAADAWQINNSKIYLGSGYTNIGIGTNDPDPNFKLHVNGNVHTDGTISAEDITIKGSAETGSGAIKLNCEANTHGVSIKGPPHSANQSYTLTLPSTAPEASKVLSTDASGNLSWVDPGSSSASSIQNITTTASKVTIDTEMDVTNNVTIKGSVETGSGAIKLNCELNSHGVAIQGPPHSASQSYTLTLPSTAPEASKVLSTDASGNLSWVDQASGGSGTGTSGPIELSVENIINPITSPSLLSNEISSESEYKTIYFNYDSENVNASGQTEYTLEFNNSTECDILLVGGGGGGGVDNSGGGGAGGLVFLENIQLYNGITIKVGGGGAGAPTSQATAGSNGKDSAIEFVETYIANGGGGGGTGNTSNGVHSGGNGGSGGGSAKENYTGTPGTTDQDQYILNGLRRGWGFAGGNGVDSGGGGGGGASEIGIDGDVAGNKLGGRGGDGKYVVNGTDFKTFFNITNTTIGDHVDGKVYFAGGGGGGNENNLNSTNLPDGSGYSNRGGFGGGGAGGYDTNNKSNPGIANTGGGGGGCTHFGLVDGGAGGSGIVILRYKYRKSLIIPSNYYITKPGPQITSGPVAQIETDIVSNNDLYKYMVFKYDSTNDNGSGQTEYALNFSEDTTIDLLVVAGGGGGGTGSSSSSSVAGAGGGAGGLIYKYNLSIDSRNYTIKIGRGGGGSVISSTTGGENGINSSIEKSDGSGIEGTDNFIAIGGGGGGKRTTDQTGKDGGSGGGAVGGAGIGNSLQSTSLSGGFGNQGGTSTDSAPGGGGGAGAPGSNGVRDNSTQKGHGGDGKQYNITGTYVYYAGGGGSGKGGTSTNHKNDHGIGGLGGGGNGWDNITYITSDDLKGTPHTGGGGGGGSQTTDNVNGGNGGSGVVIIRYLAKTLTQDIDTTLATKAGENIEWDTDNNKFTLSSNVAITSNLDVYNDINFMGNLYQNGELFVSGSGSGGEVTSVTSNILVHKIIEPATTPSINSVYGTPNDTEYKMMAFQYDSANDNGSEQSIYNITFDNDTICDIIIVGGGGGGGGGSVSGSDGAGGGGGAGGLVFLPGITMSSTYTINVGNGGLGQTDAGLNGADSSIERIDGTGTDGIENYIAVGGGGGGDGITTTQYSGPGNSGGSGGGGGGNEVTSGGTSTQNTYSGRGFGNAGGNSSTGSGDQGGGGGGAGGAGQTSLASSTADHGGEGGIGIHKVTIGGSEYIFKDLFGTSYGEYIESGTTTRDVGTAQDYFNLYYKSGTSTAESPIPTIEEGVYFAGGGAGKTGNSTNTNYLTYGGLGGGASVNCVTGVFGSGINGTGGGGTSGGKNEENEGVGQDSGTNGGSGIVIIRYKIKKIFDDVTSLFQPQFYTSIAEPSVANYGDVTTNLIAHYKFDGNLNNSIDNNIGTLVSTNTSAQFVDTSGNFVFGKSALVNNTTLTIPNFHFSDLIAGTSKSFTISFWFKANNIAGTWNILFDVSKYGSSNNGGIRFYIKSDTQLVIVSYNGTSSDSIYISSLNGDFTDDKWRLYTFVFTYNSNTADLYSYDINFYEDSVLNGSVNTKNIKSISTDGFQIGDGNPDTTYYNEGYYDDFRIYDRTLLIDEIEKIYKYAFVDNKDVKNSDNTRYYSLKYDQINNNGNNQTEYTLSFAEYSECEILLLDDNNYNYINYSNHNFYGNYTIKVGTSESSIEQSATNYVKSSNDGISYTLIYDFSSFNDLASIQNYISTIPNATTNVDIYSNSYFGFYISGTTNGYFSMIMPDDYDNIKVEYSNSYAGGTVDLHIGPADNLVNVSSVGASSSSGTFNKNTYEGTYIPGQTLKIDESSAVIGNDLKITFIKNNYNSITGISTNYNTNNVIVKYKTKTLTQDIDTTLANKAGENIEWDTDNNKFTLTSNVTITSNLDVYNDINFMGNLYQNGELFVSGNSDEPIKLLVENVIATTLSPTIPTYDISPDSDYKTIYFNYDSGNVNASGQTEYTLGFSGSTECDILLVGGGGGGGSDNSGGGGAGGLVLLENIQLYNNVTIKVGGGGAGAASGQSNTGQLGKDSSIEFSETYIAKGGGGGGTGQSSGVHSGTSGGSGGGSAYEGHDGSPGTSTQDQYLFNGLRRGWGFAGGDGKSSVGSSQGAGGGGGGASEVGIDGNIAGNQLGGHGGDGKYEVNGSDFKTIFNITDTTIGDHIDDKVYFAGGGGGGNDNDTNSTNLSDGSGYNNRGGFGGGGNGGHNSSNRSFPGIANTGGGGGGATFFSTNYKGGDGGSGIVILRYKYRKSLNIPSHYYVEKPGPQITSGPVAQVTNSYVTGSELYKYIMFTYDVANDNGSNQTEYALNFSEDTNADILIVAGGGAGGSSHSANGPGGGGGGGVIYLTNVKMQYNVYTIKVGKGGTGVTNGQGQNGFTSSISNGTITIESEGGGAGASSGVNANNGASGGGGDSGSGNTFGTGITKDITLFDNTLVSDYKLGNDGGNYYNLSSGSGGGGGGADSVGQTPTSNNGGDGGDGKNILITGSNTYYGGGGGGGGYTTTSGGSGGLGGGGFAQNNSNGSKNGIDGLGGGGGATKTTQSGGNGGSGVVIIRYLAKSLGQNIDNTLKNKAGENIEWDNTAKKYNLASDVTIANNLIVTGNIIQQYGMGTTESYLFLQTSAVFQNDDIDLYENRKTLITQLAWSPDGQWQSFGGTNKIAEQLQNCFTYFLKGNRRDGNIHIITLNNSQTNATADRKYYAMRISSTQMKVWGSYDTTYPLAYSSALTWVFSSGATIYKTF